MNILVTGVAGFIGYHTAKRLIKEGHSIVGIDNLNNYYDVNLKREKFRDLNMHSDCFMYKCDLTDKESISYILKTNKIDLVIHLGAQAGVRYSLENPDAYIDSNIKGTLNVFELCKEFNIKKCIYASSSSVYGGIKEFPWVETMDTSNPVSLYASTKKMNELMAHNYNHLYGIEMIGLRFFTVYGIGGRPDMMLWKFTEKILNGDAIDVYNHGDMDRDFTYIDDIVDGIVSCISLKKNCEIYNLGNDNPVKLMDVISTLEKEIGIIAKKNMMDIQPGDVQKTYADITKARKDFGYNPSTNIEDGIKTFVEWFKDRYK